MPKTGTKEWSAHSFNCTLGCVHDCKYCYAKTAAVNRGLCTPDEWLMPRPHHFGEIKGKKKGTIMFPTQHDITPENLDTCLAALLDILTKGNNVLIVSKPHISVIKTLCSTLEPFKALVEFRFTMGSWSNDDLDYWEPGAPAAEERAEALLHAFGCGYSTSVSMEPLLLADEDEVVEWVEVLQGFVTGEIWIGNANQLLARMADNGHTSEKDLSMANALLEAQTFERTLSLYNRLKTKPKIAWKDSIKTLLGSCA